MFKTLLCRQKLSLVGTNKTESRNGFLKITNLPTPSPLVLITKVSKPPSLALTLN
jgi:hypothetical protein